MYPGRLLHVGLLGASVVASGPPLAPTAVQVPVVYPQVVLGWERLPAPSTTWDRATVTVSGHYGHPALPMVPSIHLPVTRPQVQDASVPLPAGSTIQTGPVNAGGVPSLIKTFPHPRVVLGWERLPAPITTWDGAAVVQNEFTGAADIPAEPPPPPTSHRGVHPRVVEGGMPGPWAFVAQTPLFTGDPPPAPPEVGPRIAQPRVYEAAMPLPVARVALVELFTAQTYNLALARPTVLPAVVPLPEALVVHGQLLHTPEAPSRPEVSRPVVLVGETPRPAASVVLTGQFHTGATPPVVSSAPPATTYLAADHDGVPLPSAVVVLTGQFHTGAFINRGVEYAAAVVVAPLGLDVPLPRSSATLTGLYHTGQVGLPRPPVITIPLRVDERTVTIRVVDARAVTIRYVDERTI